MNNICMLEICIRDSIQDLAEVSLAHSSLTHDRHLALGQLRHRPTDRDLQRRYVERRHVVLAAALIVVVDDVLAHVVVRSRILDVRLAPSIVHDEHQHQNCGNFE